MTKLLAKLVAWLDRTLSKLLIKITSINKTIDEKQAIVNQRIDDFQENVVNQLQAFINTLK